MKNLICKFEELIESNISKFIIFWTYWSFNNKWKRTNKLEWEKARIEWRNIFPYNLSYKPIGPKSEEVKGISIQ